MDAFAATSARSPVTRRLAQLLALLFGLFGVAGVVAAAEAVSEPQTAAQAAAAESPLAAPAEAELKVNNRVLLTFRATLYGVSPADRAKRARVRILEQLHLKGPLEVSVESSPLGQLVMIDGATSFAVVAGDTDDPKQKASALANQAAKTLKLVIAESRESRDFRALGVAALYTVAATLALVALLWLLHLLERRVGAWGVLAAQRRTNYASFGPAGRLLGERIGPAVRWLTHGLQVLLVIALVYEWLVFVLARFALTRAWSERLDMYLVSTLVDLGTAVVDALPGLFTALVIFLAARVVVRGVEGLFDRVQAGQLELGWLDPDLARPTRRIASTAIWLFALAMAYPYLPGAQTDAFKGLSVLVGLMISLGASNLVGQGASGLILTYSRVIRAGEYVRVAEHEGTVVEMGMFTTRVRTGLGEELTLPNSLILGNVTKNYSRTVKGHGFILDTTVTIGYDTAWRQVQAMLIEAAIRTPGVLAEPAPHVFQTALSDFYPEYRLVCQAIPAEPRPRAEVLNLLHANIQDVFAENGVQIMSPHYLGDPGEAKVPPLPMPGRAG